MTVAVSTYRSGPYTGNGVATSFAFDFKVFAKADVRVILTTIATGTDADLVLDSDYSVTLNSDQEADPGGSITYPISGSPMASTHRLTVASNLAIRQPLDITNLGGFYPQTQEEAFDRAVILIGQLDLLVQGSFRLPLSAPAGISTELPLPEANAIVAWNEAGSALQNLSIADLATVVSYGTANADIFSGDGVTQDFTLSDDPGALNNLDVSISGVQQKPADDYTWSSGTTLHFVAAPPSGTRNILVRYMQGLAQGTSDSASASFIQDGAGAVVRVAQDKLREVVTPADFGAVGNGSTDDRAALNLFFTACAAGARGDMGGPDKTYAISAPLTAVAGGDILVGGNGAFILYTGASTTPATPLLDFGNGTTEYERLDLRGFGIGSSTAMITGAAPALRVRKYTGVELDLNLNGPPAHYGKLWDGIHLPGTSIINLHSTRIHVKAKGVLWHDGVELHCNHAYISGSVGTLGVDEGSGVGIYCAGGCGGLYTENLNQLFNEYGILIDRAESTEGNTQFFFSPHSTLDSNKTAALYVDDTVSNPVGKILRLDGWFASTSTASTGNGISIVNFADGTVVAGTATITNNAGAGLSCDDQTVKLTLGSGTKIYGNTGWGVVSDGAWTIISSADVRDNTAGNYHSNVTPTISLGAVTITGTLSGGGNQLNNVVIGTSTPLAVNASVINPRSDPSTLWGIDFAAAGTYAITAAGIKTLAAGSGYVLLSNNATGGMALFRCNAGGVTKVDGDAEFVAGAPGSNEIGVDFSTNYRVRNGYATTQNIFIGTIKVRTSS